MVMGGGESDEEAIRQLATSLATFLRYTVFAEDDDCHEMVEKILAEINDKQAGICVARFYRTDSYSPNSAESADECECGCCDDCLTNDSDLIDHFLEAIRQRQMAELAQQNAESKTNLGLESIFSGVLTNGGFKI
jgi:hypothetical protein